MNTPRIGLLGVALALFALTACSTGEPGPAPEPPKSPEASGQTVQCDYVAESGAEKQAALPESDQPADGAKTVTLRTSAGELSLELDSGRAPCTVGSFVSLAEQGFFDSSYCHRLTTEGIFVLQCGDPSGTGSGGPGYSFADELEGTASADYAAGAIAMANAGPDTNGSQFFLVYDDSTVLPPSYTVFGKLDAKSLELVKSIAGAGTADGGPDGAPATRVTIESASLS